MFDVINLKQSKKKYFVFLIAKYKKKETEVYNKCFKVHKKIVTLLKEILQLIKNDI